jgi:hypothetical protein
MSAAKRSIGARLRAAREQPLRPDGRPRWSRAKWAIRLRSAADRPDALPDVPSLVDMIKQWEAGKHVPGPLYQPLYARLTGMTEADLFGPPPVAGAAPVPVPGDYAATVRDTNTHLVALDSRYGGTHTAAMAMHAFTAARSALATGRHDAADHDLQAAAGETGEIAAWCLYDADRLPESRAVTHEAMMISRLAGDRSMELFELSHLALLDVHQRHPAEALTIAEQTIEAGRLAPRVEALFKIRAARALAQGGHRSRALRALGQAAGALQGSLTSRDPRWTWWLDGSEMAWHRGIVHLELGEQRTAMPHLEEAARGRLERGPYDPAGQGATVAARGKLWGRAAYNDLVHLLHALTGVAAWREAEEIMPTVADFARQVSSARTEVMLRRAIATTARAGAGPPSPVIGLGGEIAAVHGWTLP